MEGFSLPAAKSSGIQRAQCLVEGDDLADFRMNGEKRNHVAAVAEHILGKSLQRFFGPDFHKDARAGVVQRAQALHELHGSCDLLGKNVQHLRYNVGPHGIKLAVHVGYDRQARRLEVQALQFLSQRLAGPRHDRGVERVADRQRHRVITSLLERSPWLARPLGSRRR